MDCVNKLNAFEKAALVIQRRWRTYLDSQIFQCLRKIICFIGDTLPLDVLKFLNRQELALNDPASDLIVRLKLDGKSFPPTICYKIFTRRPVQDLCSNSPKDYILEKCIHGPIPPCRIKEFEWKKKVVRGRYTWYQRNDTNGWRNISELSLVSNVLQQRSYKRKTNEHWNAKKIKEVQLIQGVVPPSITIDSEARRELSSHASFLNSGEIPTPEASMANTEGSADLITWAEKADFEEYISQWNAGVYEAT